MAEELRKKQADLLDQPVNLIISLRWFAALLLPYKPVHTGVH